MTREEKAKAYDEAVNKIKPLYEQAKRDGNPIWSTYEYLIPELKESEDERIRKELVEQLEYIIPDKEEYDDEGRILPTYHKRIGRYRAYLERQKEQKPSEWSEEDEKIFNNIIEKAKGGHWIEVNEITWLINRFKSLRPQPKEERSDYITPNKEFFQWIYDRLVNVHKENPDVDYMRSFKKRIDNLDFDGHPHWKPSEEHLSALLAVFNDPDNIGSQTCQLALTDLYEQLKAIKEDK